MATEVAAHSSSHPSLLTSGAAPAYERHRPEETALYTVVCEQLETLLARVLAGTARRIARLVASRAEGDDDALARDGPLLATLAAASLRSRVAMGPGAGQRWQRLGDRVEPDGEEPDPEASPHIP